MNSLTKLSLLIASLFFLLSTKFENKGISAVYGVGESNRAQIKLELNQDYTFYYQDFSRIDQPIKVKGKYCLNEEEIKLLSDHPNRFHQNWKILKNGMVIKSRNKLAFYTLHKQ